MPASALQEKHLRERDTWPDPLRLRIHRALSWLARSEALADDPDTRFILQWIAFNAAYARKFDGSEGERMRSREFLATIARLDEERRLHAALFGQFSGPIRTLVENKFAFEPFWIAERTHDPSNRWAETFAGSKKAALAAVLGGDTVSVLAIVFDRLHVVRNQLVHGAATWASSVNRPQLNDAAAILGTVVPLVVDIMMEHPEQAYGEVLYPVIG